MTITDRRAFLITGGVLGLAAAGGSAAAGVWRAGRVDEYESGLAAFPSQDPGLVRETVLHAHSSVEKVRALVTARPELAKATVDWGFGDWETALGAASHMGNREMAELLIEHGARPDLFTFAMLDQVEVVEAYCAANPGMQRLRGPHGFTLMHHARMGKAQRTLAYLGTIEGADDGAESMPLGEGEAEVFVGEYSYGSGETERFTISLHERMGRLRLQRGDRSGRVLRRIGEGEFSPVGADSVTIRFGVEGGRATGLTIHQPAPMLSARRVGG